MPESIEEVGSLGGGGGDTIKGGDLGWESGKLGGRGPQKRRGSEGEMSCLKHGTAFGKALVS